MNDKILDYDELRYLMDAKVDYPAERMMHFAGMIWACAILDAITPQEFGKLSALNYKKHFDFMQAKAGENE